MPGFTPHGSQATGAGLAPTGISGTESAVHSAGRDEAVFHQYRHIFPRLPHYLKIPSSQSNSTCAARLRFSMTQWFDAPSESGVTASFLSGLGKPSMQSCC